jgi:pimeloyl-ACP methyl ester carboxylesterase
LQYYSWHVSRSLALLIPGLDGTGRLYYRQVERLAERYRVLPWNFGTGGAFDHATLVAALAEATSEEPAGSLLVVGESFGGTVAIEFALAHPDRVGALALVNAFAHYRRRYRIRLACRLAPLLAWRGARAIKDLIAVRTLARESIGSEDLGRYLEVVRSVDRAGYCRRLELVRDVDLRARLGEIRARTVLFASGRDKIVPSLEEARFMAARIPNAELHEFPEAGHALLLTPGFLLADYL